MDLQQQKVHIEKAQNFMRQYRDPESRELKKLSANQFMDVWSHYDGDGNGYIEGTELDGFLKEFVSSANATDLGPESLTDEMLVELKSCFMEAYDDNQDGKIDIRERFWRRLPYKRMVMGSIPSPSTKPASVTGYVAVCGDVLGAPLPLRLPDDY